MTRLFVGRLQDGTTEVDLRALFAKHGCSSAELAVDRWTREPRGFGFVEIEGDPAAAIQDLHGAKIRGERIVVKLATARQPY